MSHINNYRVYMSKKTLAKLSFSAVEELSDEVAATCNGGTASIFRDVNFKGGSVNYSSSDSSLTDNNFNDTTSSIVITGNEQWAFYRDVNFKGPSVTLGAGRYSRVSDFGILNDSISSLRRLQ